MKEITIMKEMMEKIEMVMNYEDAKDYVKVKLSNKRKAKGITKSAAKYGFDDLVLEARVEVEKSEEETVNIVVTDEILEMWGVTADEVFDKGIENIEYEISSFMGVMTIVSNANLLYGAVSVIKAREELREMFPDGYYVLPSSVHEVIILPMNDEVDEEYLTNTVQMVNAGCVDEDEQLSDRIYRFIA